MKYLTKQLLDAHHIPTAPWKVVWRDHIEFPTHLQTPLVCKHVDKQKGIGFEKNIMNLEDLERYYKKYPLEERILMEETLVGKEYRVLLIGRKVFSVLERQWQKDKKTVIEVFEQMTPEVTSFFEHIATVFKADILAIDVLMEDISIVPEIHKHHGILELNSAPSLYRHYHPDLGVGKNPATAIFDLLVRQYS